MAIHGLDRQRGACRELERCDGARHGLQPFQHVVLVLRLHDAGFQATCERQPEDQVHAEHQHQCEDDEARIVEREQREAEQHLQRRRRDIEQQLGHCLLDQYRLEEPVHLQRQVGLLRGLEADARHEVRELEGQAREDALLDGLDHRFLQQADHAGDQGTRGREQDQQHHRLQYQAALHELRDALHRDGHSQAEEAHEHGVEINQANVAPLGVQQLTQALDRCEMLTRLVVHAAVTPITQDRRQPHRNQCAHDA